MEVVPNESKMRMGYKGEGGGVRIVSGYRQVPRGLLHCPHPLDVRKGSAVRRIVYSTDNLGAATVECEDGSTILLDAVVSTIPLGVLKDSIIDFNPALPTTKIGAIERLSLKIQNEVALVYNEPF